MSTYMEAFPVGSAAHMQQPTPMPGTGGSRPVMGPPSGMVGASASSSGLYDPSGSVVGAPGAKKSKTGLIVAIFVVLAAGGGIAAVALSSGGGGGTAPGSGSQVASNDPGSGSQAVAGSNGSHALPANPGSGSAVVTPAGSGSNVVQTGSDHGSDVTPKPAESVDVLIMTKPYIASFEVWSAGKKLIDGPDMVQVTPGTPLQIVIKAPGFKDQPMTLDGAQKKVMAKLVAKPGHPHTASPPPPPPPGHPDCSAKILDAKDPRCRAQYCATHEGDMNCNLE
jgi:hypothetical protein